MRYIECGIQDKDNAYCYDSSVFDIFSYFIYFDNTAQQADLAGLMDESSVDFSFCDQDYFNEFITQIAPLSDSMLTRFKSFDTPTDLTTDVTYDTTNAALVMNLAHFIDKIDIYNRQVTSHYYYDHGIRNAYPFAELLVVKPRGEQYNNYIMSVMLNKFITKDVGQQAITYTLNTEPMMSKYFFHYSTYESDFTSIFIKLLYNLSDVETVNKPSLVTSEILQPTIKQDSSLLFFNINIDSTTAEQALKYTFFDLTSNELIFINNRYLCRVKDITDTTTHPTSMDWTFNTQYCIELLDFDSTDQLEEYMGNFPIYNDFTRVLYNYHINIRVLKKIDSVNDFFNDSTGFFKMLLPIKTFFGADNRATNEVASDWKSFFVNPSSLDPIAYSGTYDVTNNIRLNMLSLLDSFSSDKYSLPYDATIIKQYIPDKTSFTIDLFIQNASDVTRFLGNLVTNGIYIFNEAGIKDAMILRLIKLSSINSNTYKLTLMSVGYDDTWYAGIPSIYHIPSGSWLIQWKYHIYNIVPYIRFDKFSYSNDINNLITIHSFAYTSDDPSVLQWNGRTINI